MESPPMKSVLKQYINRSVGIVTALNPVLGYEKTTELAKEALKSGKGILELIREQHLLTEDQIKKLLDPATMTGQQYSEFVIYTKHNSKIKSTGCCCRWLAIVVIIKFKVQVKIGDQFPAQIGLSAVAYTVIL